ncbi:MAG: 7-cyano-7-deazaguanine synthase [Verrucomicrobiota bacterium]
MEADFLWLALSVYLADRFAPRQPYGVNAPTFWRRRIHLQIPVRLPERWTATATKLAAVLEFLTEDDWSFDFVPGRSPFSVETQEHFPNVRRLPADWTALFSGGLDSLAGAVWWLQRTESVGLLVSGQTHSRIACGQALQVDGLCTHFPGRVEHLGMSYGLSDKNGLNGFESSQRARGFIHTSLGCLAALMQGHSELLLFENGVGAFNLPCDTAQFGSQNSRGAHPLYLRRMAAFVSAAFSRPFAIINPFTFATKSQMLGAGCMGQFASLFQKSFSCDRYPNYPHKASQCGSCPSCLVRRLAFFSAGLTDAPDGYSVDVFRPSRSFDVSQSVGLTKLATQAGALGNALESEDPWHSLCALWPDLLRTELVFGAEAIRGPTMALFRRHVDEWKAFSSAIHPGSVAFAE